MCESGSSYKPFWEMLGPEGTANALKSLLPCVPSLIERREGRRGLVSVVTFCIGMGATRAQIMEATGCDSATIDEALATSPRVYFREEDSEAVT